MPGPHEEFAYAVRCARSAAEESFEAWLFMLGGQEDQGPGGTAEHRPWDATVAFEMTVRTSVEASHTKTGEWRLSAGSSRADPVDL